MNSMLMMMIDHDLDLLKLHHVFNRHILTQKIELKMTKTMEIFLNVLQHEKLDQDLTTTMTTIMMIMKARTTTTTNEFLQQVDEPTEIYRQEIEKFSTMTTKFDEIRF